MKIRATIKGDKIVCDKSLWQTYLAGLQGDVSIEIKKWVKDRTYDQNRLLWKYYEIICESTGDDANSTHEFLKRKLLPPRFITVMNKTIKIPASTTKLSTIEMTNYLDKISALTGVQIPNYEQI